MHFFTARCTAPPQLRRHKFSLYSSTSIYAHIHIYVILSDCCWWWS